MTTLLSRYVSHLPSAQRLLFCQYLPVTEIELSVWICCTQFKLIYLQWKVYQLCFLLSNIKGENYPNFTLQRMDPHKYYECENVNLWKNFFTSISKGTYSCSSIFDGTVIIWSKIFFHLPPLSVFRCFH